MYIRAHTHTNTHALKIQRGLEVCDVVSGILLSAVLAALLACSCAMSRAAIGLPDNNKERHIVCGGETYSYR